jgi:K+-sensing histidine kinase KdpD
MAVMPSHLDRKQSASSRASLLRGVLVGLACAAGATALRELLDFEAPSMAAFPLVFPAVLIATLASGVSGGLVALILGMAAADYFFVPPRFTFRPENLAQGLTLVVTALALLVVLWLTARYRNTMLARADERREEEEHLRSLVREVDHRANNLLAVVQSMVNLTNADSVEALKRDLLGRIGALGRAHQLHGRLRINPRAGGQKFAGRSWSISGLGGRMQSPSREKVVYQQ